jgi:hypothetical protein
MKAANSPGPEVIFDYNLIRKSKQMKKAANEGIVMVLIWTILAIAVSILGVARGSQSQTSGVMIGSNDPKANTTSESTMSSEPSTEARPQQTGEITKANWQRDPRIRDIQKIVGSVNAGLKVHTFKTAERKYECEEVPYFTLMRIARDSKGSVTWYETYSEGEDSSWDDHYYYDNANRLRFVLMTCYAANGTREQHRLYFDGNGKLIWRTRKLLKGPGYFGPQDVEELVKMDPAKDFAESLGQGCKEIKKKATGHSR